MNNNVTHLVPISVKVPSTSQFTVTIDNIVHKRKSSQDNKIYHVEEFTSVREFCIYVLEKHGIHEDINPSENGPSSLESSIFMSCKICNKSESIKNTLICDVCEEAFHVSCCKLRAKKLPTDNWCCIYCSRISKISRMLMDNQPYVSRVDTCEDFQEEVPEWTGRVSKKNNIMDPEPGRCRRTDGKKWRCAKDAVPEQKYCEKHLIRNRRRSRKLVEQRKTRQKCTAGSFSTNAEDIAENNKSEWQYR